jgi:hypothetical protein
MPFLVATVTTIVVVLPVVFLTSFSMLPAGPRKSVDLPGVLGV